MAEKQKTLLDLLAESAGCAFLSDLRNVNPERRGRLAKKLESIPPEAYPLPAWNDALSYLLSAPAEAVPDAARQRLIGYYVNSEETLLQSLSKEELL